MIPHPLEQPLLRPEDLIGLHPTLRRSAIYEAIRRGEVPSLTVGRRIYLPTAEVWRWLHLDPDSSAAAADTAASAPIDGTQPPQAGGLRAV